MDAPEVKDRDGVAITTDSFVLIERENHLAPGHPYRRQGQVVAVTSDHAGALIEVREWKAGRFNGKRTIARAPHLQVIRAPDRARAELAEEARIRHDRKVRKEENERQARLKKLRAEEEKKR